MGAGFHIGILLVGIIFSLTFNLDIILIITQVTKKDGTVVPFDADKINRWSEWACSCTTAKWSNVVNRAMRKMHDGILTSEIQKALITSCVELIEMDVDYDRVAAKLLLADIRKPIFGKSMIPPTFKAFYKRMVSEGLWSDLSISDELFELAEERIDHARDDKFSYGGLKQVIQKYILKREKRILETPQFFYMAIAIDGMRGSPYEDMMDTYDLLSLHQINVPTPVQLGLRTSSRGFASCCVVRAKDSLQSIGAAQDILYMMTANRAGIGVELDTRSVGDPVRKGEVVHAGKLNYYKLMLANVNANSQQCYSDDTSVLTSCGYILFSDLNSKHKVAQVQEDGTITFVRPLNVFEYDNGPQVMHLYSSEKVSLLVTDNHRMSFVDRSSEGMLLEETVSSDLDLSLDASFVLSGSLSRSSRGHTSLSYYEKIALCCHLFGKVDPDNEGVVLASLPSLAIVSYLDSMCTYAGLRTIKLGNQLKIHSESLSGHICDLSFVKLDSVNYLWCEDFIDYLWQWYPELSNSSLVYSSNHPEALRFVTSVANLCNVSAIEAPIFGALFLTKGDEFSLASFEEVSRRDIAYEGKTYCVEVPSGRIMVRREGKSVVSGNSRGGSATVQFNIFDPEIESLIRLKSQRVSEERRIDKLDYSLAVNDFFIRKMIRNEEITLFSRFLCPDLYELFFRKDLSLFIAEYHRCEELGLGAGSVKGGDFLSDFMKQRVDTGRMYIHRVDESNRRSMYKDPIISSNLCVAGDTVVLTRMGYLKISSLQNKVVPIWNGEVYSDCKVMKTSELAHVSLVTLSNGYSLTCTAKHKWYVENRSGQLNETPTENLKSGDIIERYVAPIAGGVANDHAYVLGCKAFKEGNRSNSCLEMLSWDFSSRVQFLRGVVDSSGSEGYSVVSIMGRSKEDLNNLSMGLTLIGIRCSKMYTSQGSVFISFPRKQYENALENKPRPVFIDNVHVVSVEHNSHYESTYCFTEPLKHKAVFNGIYTGQCLEILEPTEGYDSPRQLYENSGTGFVRYLHSGSEEEVISGTSEILCDKKTGYDLQVGDVLTGGNVVQHIIERKQDAEVALCNLGGIVCGRIKEEDYARAAYLLLKLVDNVIDFQSYPFPAMEYTASRRRNAGIGLINIAYGLANEGFSYESEDGRNFVHRETEKFSYYLHLASIQLAKERGACEWFNRTLYSEGLLPMDISPKSVDNIHTQSLVYDWDIIRKGIAKYGMRNSILEAGMPSETSSVTINATNSCEPIRDHIIYKSGTTGSVPFIVPDYKRLKEKYELAFDIDQKEYSKVVAIMQKFFGQSISYNEYYNYNKYPNSIIPIIDVIETFVFAAKLGIKTWYYLNTEVSNGGAAGQKSSAGCESGGCTL